MADQDYAVIWSKRAISDLREIADYISEDSLQAAERMIDQIDAVVQRLHTFPLSGRVVPELRR
ncbi:MAG: type II toxin-antitoxin system RelE/ParE family toxin [Armatimonadetes bacterium]|nr:type II toxin-antitoxin system RelE/ParE family toxin [Armatimonadota bacterium]